MSDVEMRLVAQQDDYIRGMREAMDANQRLYNQATENAKQEKRHIDEIKQAIEELKLKRMQATSTKEQERYNKKIQEANIHLQEGKVKLSQYTQEQRKANEAVQSHGKSSDFLRSSMMKLVGVVGGAYGAWRAFRSIIGSTDKTADAFRITMGGINNGLTVLKQSIATMNFRDLIDRMADAIKEGRAYQESMIDIEHRFRAIELRGVEARAKMSEAMVKLYDREGLTIKERQDALEEFNRLNQEMLDDRLKAVDLLVEAEKKDIFSKKLANDIKLTEEQIDMMVDYVKQYDKLTDNELKNVQKAIDAQKQHINAFKEINDQRRQGESIAAALARQQAARNQYNIQELNQIKEATIAALSEEEKELLKLNDARELFTTEERNRIANALKQYEEANIQKLNSDRRAERYNQQLIREREAERKAHQAKLLADQKKFLDEMLKLEDQAEMDRIAKMEGDERFRAEEEFALKMIERQRALFQKELDESVLSKAEKEDIQRQHNAAMILLIDAVHDETMRKSGAFHGQEVEAKRQHNEEMRKLALDVELAEADMLDATGLRRLEILMARKQREIALLEESGTEESELRARLAQTELKALNDQWDQSYADLLNAQEDFNEEFEWGWRDYVNIVQMASSQVMGIIRDANNFRLQEASRERSILDTRIAEHERALQAEISIAETGAASNIATERKRLEDLRQARDEAMKREEEAIKKQQQLETISQATSLITATANILKGFSTMPVAGQILAIGAIAAMFGAFAKAKIDAAKVTKLEKGGTGTKTGIITGKSHAQGGERFLEHVEVERDERWGVLSASKSAKYGKEFDSVISAMNAGTYRPATLVVPKEKERVKRNEDLMAIRTEIERLNRHFHGSETITTGVDTHGRAYRLVKSGNRVRKIYG